MSNFEPLITLLALRLRILASLSFFHRLLVSINEWRTDDAFGQMKDSFSRPYTPIAPQTLILPERTSARALASDVFTVAYEV